MIYFTSDLHLGHTAVIRMNQRPFADVEEMNRVLIDHINEIVKPDDTLYILGDLSYKLSVIQANELIQTIRCRNKYLIKGNHDKNYAPELFKEIVDFKHLALSYSSMISYDVSLMHYPMLEWPRSRHGSIQMHGHIHSKDSSYNLKMRDEHIRRYDVGVDANNYMPVSFEDIVKFMKLD